MWHRGLRPAGRAPHEAQHHPSAELARILADSRYRERGKERERRRIIGEASRCRSGHRSSWASSCLTSCDISAATQRIYVLPSCRSGAPLGTRRRSLSGGLEGWPWQYRAVFSPQYSEPAHRILGYCRILRDTAGYCWILAISDADGYWDTWRGWLEDQVAPSIAVLLLGV